MTHYGRFFKLDTGELTVFQPDPETPHSVHDGTLHRHPPGPWTEDIDARPFIVVCSWCESFKRTDNGWSLLEPGSRKADLARRGWRMSHGICPDCYKKQMETIKV